MDWKLILVLLTQLAFFIYMSRLAKMKYSRGGVIAHALVFAVAVIVDFLQDHRLVTLAFFGLCWLFVNFRYPMFAEKRWPEQPRLTQEGKQILADSERLHQVLEIISGGLSRPTYVFPQDSLLQETALQTSHAGISAKTPMVWFGRYLLCPFSPYWLETPLYTEEQLACARESLDADSQKLLDEALELDVKLRRMVMSEQANVLVHH